MDYLSAAIQRLAPGAQYSMNNDNYGSDNPLQFKWNSLDIPMPTKLDVFNMIKVIRIQEAINSKIAEVETWKNNEFEKTISSTVNGVSYLFQKDSYSKKSLSFALQNKNIETRTICWVTADNTIVDMNKDDFINLISIISDFDTNVVTHGIRMKNYINTFTIDTSKIEETIIAINSINILDIN